jgi:hypothetical protein
MGWNIYFVIFAIYLISIYLPFPASSYKTFFDYLNMPITLISLIGLYGLASKRTIFLRRVWAYWFYGAATWHFLYEYYLRHILFSAYFESPLSRVFSIHSLTDIFVLLFPTLIRLPLFAGLYLYAFRSDDLWERESF